jgi:hypothetical protein
MVPVIVPRTGVWAKETSEKHKIIDTIPKVTARSFRGTVFISLAAMNIPPLESDSFFSGPLRGANLRFAPEPKADHLMFASKKYTFFTNRAIQYNRIA